MWLSEDNIQESALSFYLVGPWDWTEVSHQSWQQAPLPSEPSCWLILFLQLVSFLYPGPLLIGPVYTRKCSTTELYSPALSTYFFLSVTFSARSIWKLSQCLLKEHVEACWIYKHVGSWWPRMNADVTMYWIFIQLNISTGNYCMLSVCSSYKDALPCSSAPQQQLQPLWSLPEPSSSLPGGCTALLMSSSPGCKDSLNTSWSTCRLAV